MKYTEWFKHDNNARHDPKILLMVQKKGPVAKAVFWDLVEMLHEFGGMMLVCDAVDMVVYENHLSDDSIPRYIIYDSGLFATDEEGYCYSERLQREIGHMNIVREARSRAGNASVKSKKEANAEQMLNKCSTEDEHSLKNIENISSLHSDILEKENIENKKEDNISSSISLDNPLLVFEEEPLITPEEFRELWNNGCGRCTKAAKLTEQRIEKAESRLAEFGKTRKEQMDTILKILQNVRDSDFLQNQWSGCSFIWITANPNNWLKVYEGQYRNKGGQKPEQASMIDKLKEDFDYIDNYFGNGEQQQQDSGIDEQ